MKGSNSSKTELIADIFTARHARLRMNDSASAKVVDWK